MKHNSHRKEVLNFLFMPSAKGEYPNKIPVAFLLF